MQTQPVRASHRLAMGLAVQLHAPARPDDSSPRREEHETTAGLTATGITPPPADEQMQWRCAAVTRLLSRRPLDTNSSALNVALYGSAGSPTHRSSKVSARSGR